MNVVGALVLLLLASPQESVDKQVATLLEKIRAEEIEARDAAAKELIGLGEPAVDAVERAAAASADAETAARLKAIVVQIRRNALIVKVAPPPKRVTVSASDVPLRDFLKDVCGQAGVEFVYDGAAGDKPVTVDAKDETILQVVDRACAARGDLVASVADGKLKITSGAGGGEASAYAQGYRVRVRRRVVTDTAEAGAVRTSAVLYFDLDAPPDHKIRAATMTLARTASASDREIPVKGLAESNPRMGGFFGVGTTAVVVDGVAVMIEGSDSADRVCVIKEMPAGLTSLDSLKVTARFRYSVGLKQVSVPLTLRGSDRLPEIPYNVQFAGQQQIYFMPADHTRPVPLDDFVDMESMVLIGKDGKENKLGSVPVGGVKGRHYMFSTERPVQPNDNHQLRIQIVDALDRDVEFELKDIKLRDHPPQAAIGER